MKHILAVLVLLPICLVLRLAAQAPGQQPPAQKNTAQPSPQQGATYVGQDTCIGCHDAEGKQIHGTAHGKSENPRSPAAAHGCESCHGPGSAHVEDPSKPGSIKRFTTLPAREASTRLNPNIRCATGRWIMSPTSAAVGIFGAGPTKTRVGDGWEPERKAGIWPIRAC